MMIHPDPSVRISSKNLLKFLLTNKASERTNKRKVKANEKNKISRTSNNKLKTNIFKIKTDVKINLPKTKKLNIISHSIRKHFLTNMLNKSSKNPRKKQKLQNSSKKFEICSTHLTNKKKKCQMDKHF